jgi:hypothetical protein
MRLIIAMVAASTVVGSDARAEEEDPGPSPARAATLAAVGTLACMGGLGLAAYADNVPASVAGGAVCTAAPSAGHWYAGASKHATLSSMARGVGVVVLFGGAASRNEEDGDLRDLHAMTAGLGIIAASILIDLASADVAAERARKRRRATVTLAPTRIRTAGGWATGGVLDVRF